jgi:hypothetical protein
VVAVGGVEEADDSVGGAVPGGGVDRVVPFTKGLGTFFAEAVVGPIPGRWSRGESYEFAERTVGAGFDGADVGQGSDLAGGVVLDGGGPGG